MPLLNGFEMTREILKVNKHQPILIMSGYDDKSNLLRVLELNTEGFVQKPVDTDKLINKLEHISQKLSERENLCNLAYYDKLTNLPNIFLFEERAKQAISLAKRKHHNLAIFFIDIDNFKMVNDNFGHKEGDIVLKQIANDIKSITRKEDILSRRSGDEFLLLIEDVKDEKHLDILAEKIISACTQKIKKDGKSVDISCSIGIAIYPDDSDDLHQLIDFADKAMYIAKHKVEQRYTFYNTKINAKLTC